MMHMVEALGVPHTEARLILVNGESVGFDRILAEGHRVATHWQRMIALVAETPSGSLETTLASRA